MGYFKIFLLFIVILYFIGQANAAFKPIINLNSSDPSLWNNNNSIDMNLMTTDGSKVRAVLSRNKSTPLSFVCGFYCSGSCTSYSFSVIVVGGGKPAAVWSARRDRPVHENASLALTRNRGLVLRDSNGSEVWSSNTALVAGMNMTELGNLVLFNDKGNIVWQSFDYPTDTLLAGQRLYESQTLFSSVSPDISARGLYYANLTLASGLAAFTKLANGGSPQMYYKLATETDSMNQTSSTGQRCRLLTQNEINSSIINAVSNYADLLSGGFLVNLGTFGSNRSQLPLDSYVEYIRIDSDGKLKLYRHDNARGPIEIVDMVAADLGPCQYPRFCGEYGFCKEGQCICPQADDGVRYFEPGKEQPLRKGGCRQVEPFSCQLPPEKRRLVEVKNSSYFNVIDPNAANSSIKDMEGCKQACQENCSCAAAFFRYDNNASDGYCYMQTEVLTIRGGQIPKNNFTSAAYIKVGIPPPKNGINFIAIIAGSGGSVLVIFCVVMAGLIWKKCRKTSTESDGEDYRKEDYIMQVPGMPVRFTNEELRVATKDFEERLGRGGFGSVFKGVLKNGTEVAVKRLYKRGAQVKEFLAEVETIGNIHHFNLVRLLGFSAEKSFLLVFEYMSNGSLDDWIFYRGDQPNRLDWQTRKKIILGIAKGLAYLHEECRQRIIHLDIKPQNILLDENFNAKISDFGLSKLIDRDESQVLIPLRGTPGYIAPECGNSNVTVKVDIYSFGIVLLEIVTGRRNLDGNRSESSKHLLRLLQEKAEEDRLLDIVEDLEEEVHNQREEMMRLISVAAWCLQNDPTKRPIMSTVVKVLEGVMEVDPNISYKFIHATGSSSPINDLISSAPQPSVLSNPR